MRYIYVIGNVVNWKVYVGQSKNPTSRFKGHFHCAKKGIKRRFYDAIRKHGEANFRCFVLEECEDSIINERERYWITHFDSFNSVRGYNSTTGGHLHFSHSEETKRKIGETSKGNQHCRGLKHSLETRQKVSLALKNNPHVIAAKIGKKHSDETKAKMSVAHKGRQKSESTRLKMCEYQSNKSEQHVQNLLQGRRKRSKLDEDKVRQIKRAWKEEKPELVYGQSKAFCRRFALQFEVSVNAIYAIVKGKFWEEVI